MQAPPYARYNTYHNQKRQLLGNQAGNAAPAWRVNQAQARRDLVANKGSKILLSRLPVDVSESEVEALFTKTIGAVKESFIVYNSQGRSKGMAVVTFTSPDHAALARTKYNGKIIDGKRPIKLEIIKDEDETPAQTQPTKPRLPSLLERLGAPASTPRMKPAPTSLHIVKPLPSQPRKHNVVIPAAPRPTAPNPRLPQRQFRQKKGPKRIKKQAVTTAQLDREMEDYRAYDDTMES